MKNDVIVKKIIAHIEKIETYCIGADFTIFISNTQLAEACVFNLSQIGELVSKLDVLFTSAHCDIPWKAMYGLRNRIVHDYEGVNIRLVWEIVETDLPFLKKQLISILE